MQAKQNGKKILDFFQEKVEQIKELFNRIGRIFDSLFSDNRFLILISFLGAVALFVTINFSWLLGNGDNQGEVITNIPVIQIYDKDSYVVEGLPAFANLTLIGDTTDIEVVKSLKQYQIEIDLTGFSPGEHIVELRVKNIEPDVTAVTDPQQAQITITPKVTKQTGVSYELVNKANLNQNYDVEDVKLSQDTVLMKGAQATLERVAIVQALVDVTNLELGDFKGKAQLVAYDDRGNKLDVSMEPSSVDVTANVVEYSRIIPIIPVFGGNLPEGKAVKNYSFSRNAVIVYGPRNVLDTLTSIRLPLNYPELPDGQDVVVNIPLPAGAQKIEPATITVNVTYGNTTEETFMDIPITAQNLAKEYEINSEQTPITDATVKVVGTPELLRLLTDEQLKLTVNLQGLTAGTHEVEVGIDAPTYFNYQIDPKTITIVIEEK